MTDLSKRSMDLVLDLINTDNNLELTLDQVTLVPPSQPDPTEATTDMVVKALPEFQYGGSVNVTYDRLSLSEVILKAGGIGVLTERNVTFDQFIEHVAELYGINFGVGELEPVGEFNLNLGTDQQPVEVRAKDSSYAYYGAGEFTAYFNYVAIPVVEIEGAVATLGESINAGLKSIFTPYPDPSPVILRNTNG